jgi:hypothetical protein
MTINWVMKARSVTFVCSCSGSSEALRSLKNASTSVVGGSSVTSAYITSSISLKNASTSVVGRSLVTSACITSASHPSYQPPSHNHVHLLLWIKYLTHREISTPHSLAQNHSYTSVWQWLSYPPSTSYSGICYISTTQSLTMRKHGPKKLCACPSTHLCSPLLYPNHYTSNCGLHPFLRLHTKDRQLVSLIFTSYLGPTSIGKDMS